MTRSDIFAVRYPPDFAVSQFTTDIRLSTRYSASAIVTAALEPLRISTIRVDAPVSPVLPAFFLSVTVTIMFMQHGGFPLGDSQRLNH